MKRKLPKLSTWQILIGVAIATSAGLCVRDKLHLATEPTASSAQALGIYEAAPAGLSPNSARDALSRDARRREARFRDAAEPGYLFASTRVRTDELARMSPAEIYELGGQLFNHRFTRRDGYGDRESIGNKSLRRVHRGARGGPDAYTCAECHRRGGPAGAGDASDNAYLDGDGDRPASALERNPPPLHGAGLIELLAKEMSADLAGHRETAMRQAKKGGSAVKVELTTKGVSFGFLTALADGTVDVRDVQGVSPDLRVRPFGHKGHAANLRDVAESELAIHHGMQSARLVATGTHALLGEFGDLDPDGDGVSHEISDGQLAALTLFLAMQEVPQIGMPERSDFVTRWPLGQQRFRELGCAKCHVPSLPLNDTVYRLDVPGGGTVEIDLAKHGASPRIEVDADGVAHVHLFSDLKRHVVGPNLREPRGYKGVLASHFLTRPLWGIARSRPYLHDARAQTIDTAIMMHSGEALNARNAYAKLKDQERGPLRVYLMSLTRAPRLSSP